MHNVVIQTNLTSYNVDANTRAGKATVDLDNGCVVEFTTGYSQVDGEKYVWLATAPAAQDSTNIWMVRSSEVPVFGLEDGQYQWRVPEIGDPRLFYNIAGRVFTAFRPEVGNTIEMTGDGITDVDTNDYLLLNPGQYTLVSAAADAGEGFAMRKVGEGMLHIGISTIAKKRPVTYIFEVIRN